MKLSALVLAYGEEPWLLPCVRAALASTGVEVEVVVVDNGAPPDDITELRGLAGVRLVEPGVNLGFAGGMNAAAGEARGDVFVLLNSDAVVRADAFAGLVKALDLPGVGLACGSVRLADDEDVANTTGNPVHYTGLSWAGGHGQPAARFAAPREVTVAAGTCLAVRRDTWSALGGLWEPYFAYHEDVDLSWRAWQAGLRCVYTPDAVSVHRYHFSRNPTKRYLTERNRLVFVLTCFPRSLLLRALPGLLVVELAMLALSAREGWPAQKLAGYRWIWRNRRLLAARRAEVLARQVVPDRQLVPRLTGRLEAGVVPDSLALRLLDAVLRAYWVAAAPGTR